MVQGFVSTVPEKRHVKVKRPVSYGEEEQRQAYSDAIRKALSIVHKLQRHPYASPFLHPVDLSSAPHYFQVIDEPMDLSTVERNLREGKYTNAYELASDIRKIWSNAFAYNQQGSEIYKATVELSAYFETLFQGNEGLLFTSRNDAIEELCKQLEALKREIKDIKGNKTRNGTSKSMTLQEKKALGQEIRALQPQYLRGLIAILRDSLPSAIQGEELEFDLDALPVKTCRELERYVKQCNSQVPQKCPDQNSRLDDLTNAVSGSDSSSSDSGHSEVLPFDMDFYPPVDFPSIWPQKNGGIEHYEGFIMDLPYMLVLAVE